MVAHVGKVSQNVNVDLLSKAKIQSTSENSSKETFERVLSTKAEGKMMNLQKPKEKKAKQEESSNAINLYATMATMVDLGALTTDQLTLSDALNASLGEGLLNNLKDLNLEETKASNVLDVASQLVTSSPILELDTVPVEFATTEINAPRFLDAQAQESSTFVTEPVNPETQEIPNADNLNVKDTESSQKTVSNRSEKLESNEMFSVLAEEKQNISEMPKVSNDLEALTANGLQETPAGEKSKNLEPDSKITSTNVSNVTKGFEHLERLETKEQKFVSRFENNVLRQVTDKLLQNLKDVRLFKDEFSFKLNPESLGEISVRMSVRDEVLTVEFLANSKETQSILAANLESIKEMLNNLSRDNQVNSVIQNLPKDYLQQESSNEQHAGAQSQQEKPSDDSTSKTQFTEDFLSMLNSIDFKNI